MQPHRRSSSRAPIAIVGLVVASCVGVGALAARHRRSHGRDDDGIEAVLATATPLTLSDASRRVSIEMYSAAWCHACSRAKSWMRDHDVAFHEVDVDARPDAIAQLQMLNPRRTLPTFDVEGQVLVGFQETDLRHAIDGAAARRAH